MNSLRNVNLNGEYFKADEPVLACDNRGFLYGDALFETMISINDRIPFIKDHIDRLLKSMEILKMQIPLNFNESFFSTEIGRLLRRNKYFNGVRVRVTVFRNPGGLYTPVSNEVSYLIDSSPLNFDRFSLNKTGYQIDIFKDHLKPINIFSSIKSTNDLLYILAGLYKKSRDVDECIILNQKGYVCETMSSNVFIVKKQKIFTPSLESGCLNGVMRKKIIEITESDGVPLEEVPGLTIDHLKEADECFITNAVNGIRWVSGFKTERYFNKMSTFLVNKLNNLIQRK